MRSRSKAILGLLAAAASLPVFGCQGSNNAAVPKATRQSIGAPSAVEPRRVIPLEGGVNRIEIDRPESYWSDAGFVEMFPTVRVSVGAGALPYTAVFLRVPNGAMVAVERRNDGTPALRFPPGSESDRTTYVRDRRGGQPDVLTVADVRGTRFDASGVEWFHVFRPDGGQVGAPLVGYEWRRESGDEAELADELLKDHVRNHARALTRVPPGEGYVRGFSRLNRCQFCHTHKKLAATAPYETLPPWPTNANGWFVPQAVLSDSSALSTTGTFHDPNVDDAFVTAACQSGDVQLRGRPRHHFYQCDDGGMPRGRRDVRRGLAQADTYTHSVCASRAYLHARMHADDRRVFREAFAECGL